MIVIESALCRLFIVKVNYIEAAFSGEGLQMFNKTSLDDTCQRIIKLKQALYCRYLCRSQKTLFFLNNHSLYRRLLLF